MSGHVQAHALILVPAAEPVLVPIALDDALAVGLSMQIQARTRIADPTTAKAYDRVGGQLVAAARAAAKAVGR